MSSIGARLKTAREIAGLSIGDVSNNIKVLSYYLEALEDNDFNALPQRVYTIGFIKMYADLLELDAEEMCSLAKKQAGWTENEPKIEIPENKPSRNNLKSGIKYIAAVLIIITTVIYLFFR
jgi:cytoskeletal protein RodZ